MYSIDNYLPKKNVIPTHIGIIPDGTRSWARQNKTELGAAYNQAMINLNNIVKFLFNKKIKIISLYLASLYNFKRSKVEIDAFCKAEADFCENLMPLIATKFNARIKVVGKVRILPIYFQKSIKFIEDFSSRFSKKKIYLCIAYNPYDELLQAFESTPAPKLFLNHLKVKEPLDIVIRTTDTNMLSNFLPIQSGYARIYTIKKLFNDSKIIDYGKILKNFKNINRRYGE